MQDVARLAGVSIKTVSNVVNDYPHISKPPGRRSRRRSSSSAMSRTSRRRTCAADARG
ncbi:LacI family DNA-binding transcriptional regulator [Tessaracoccus flavescens]|uniref:LacI family DNA-binding transcriptional regulator n=1 Tax=Tessaracoccus flavescens TaxID=399497 RepID=UPI003AAE6331